MLHETANQIRSFIQQLFEFRIFAEFFERTKIVLPIETRDHIDQNVSKCYKHWIENLWKMRQTRSRTKALSLPVDVPELEVRMWNNWTFDASMVLTTRCIYCWTAIVCHYVNSLITIDCVLWGCGTLFRAVLMFNSLCACNLWRIDIWQCSWPMASEYPLIYMPIDCPFERGNLSNRWLLSFSLNVPIESFKWTW